MKKIAVFCMGTALCAALLAGCGSDTTTAVPEQTTSTATSTVETTSTTSTNANTTSSGTNTQTQTNGLIGQDKAASIAKEAINVSNATVVKNVLEYDDGIQVYDVDLISGNTKYTFEINATTGAILEQSQEQVTTGTAASGDISADDAVAAAKKAAGISSGTVVKNHLDVDDGRRVYEIEIVDNGYEYDFEIDATTGAVLEQSKEAQQH